MDDRRPTATGRAASAGGPTRPDETGERGPDDRVRRNEMLGLVGWGLVLGLVLAYQGFALLHPHDGWPALSDVIRAVMRYPAGRMVMFALWLWAGWHLFVRGWHFFLRA
jgi:hypothetical protein